MQRLPFDVKYHIARSCQLSPFDLLSLSHVNKSWRQMAADQNLYDAWFQVGRIQGLYDEYVKQLVNRSTPKKSGKS